MKSLVIRMIAGLLLIVVGAFIFIDTISIYPFEGYHLYECSLCGRQWTEFKELEERVTCPNRTKEEDPATGKKEYVCHVKLCAVGVEDSKAEGNYVYVKSVLDTLIVNTFGGVLAIAGLGLSGYSLYGMLIYAPKKDDEE